MLRLRGFLLPRLDCHVMADSASRHGAENGVMVGIVAGNGPHYCAFDTSGVGRRSRRRGEHQGRAGCRKDMLHPSLHRIR